MTNAVAIREEAARLEVTLFNEDRLAKIAAALPPNMDVRRFARITYQAIVKSPELLACSLDSLIVAVGEAAELGLAPTGQLNRAFLVPFQNKGKAKPDAVLIIGYEGLADLARDSGKVAHIWTRAVYEGEPFEVQEGSERFLHHTPTFTEEDPKKVVLVYAMVRFTDGHIDWEVMTKAQVEAIRAMSRAKNASAWVNHWVQMARKTVLRRLTNSLPLTPAAMSAIARDDEREFGPAAVSAEGPSRADQIRHRIASRGAPSASEAPGAPEPPETVEDATVTVIEPDEQPAVPVAPAVPQTEAHAAACGAVAPYESGGTCVREAGHKGFHKSDERESWQ